MPRSRTLQKRFERRPLGRPQFANLANLPPFLRAHGRQQRHGTCLHSVVPPRTETTGFQVANLLRIRHWFPSIPFQGQDRILVCNAPNDHSASRSIDDRTWLTINCHHPKGRKNDKMQLHIGQFLLPILYCSLIGMPIDPTPPVELLTIAEVARLLKISVSTVRRLQSARILPFVKVGGSVRFAKNDIASYLARNRVGRIGS